jgi:Mg-chelatase subunit ChlD
LASWRGLTNFSRRRLGFCLALRSLAIAAVAVALAGPEVVGLLRPTFVVFLIDSSASIAPTSQQTAEEFVDRAMQARPDRQSARVCFAASPVVAREDQSEVPVDRFATDLAAALEAGRATARADAALHLVLLSDGVATTGDTARAVDAARILAVPISTVPLASCEPEVYVSEVRTGPAVREGEAFDVEVVVRSTHDDEGTVELACPTKAFGERRVRVVEGDNLVRFRVAAEGGPTLKLTARIAGFRDTLAGNNAAATVVAVRPQPGLLLAENRPASGEHLAKAFRADRLAVEIRKPQETPASPEGLQPFDAVVLVNVPAASLSQRQMDALKDYVHRGGGLVAIGGDQAFTPGGYRKTALEEILPLRSEPLRKAPRPSLAMVLVVDRSLSMEEGAAIELAREAMRRVVQLLRPEDQLGVLAFDEQSRWVTPIEPVGDRTKVLERIASITAGGRTDMAPALEKAFLALHEAFAGQKHIVMLTDGISHPADFVALADRIARTGITLSTVALGKEASRPLLEDMARIGKGRFYACASAEAVPNVFAIETASASKLGICEEPFFPRRKKGQNSFSPPVAKSVPEPFAFDGIDLGGAPSLLGYVETQPKPGAHVVLTSGTGEPLLAWLRFGEGMSVAFTSDAEGRWGAAWLAWPEFGRFWTRVVRAALRRDEGSREPSSTKTESYANELRIRPINCDLLREIAAATGGVYQPTPESVWTVSSPGTLPPLPIHHWLLAAAAVLFVLDATARRLP